MQVVAMQANAILLQCMKKLLEDVETNTDGCRKAQELWKKTGNPTGDNSPGNKQLLIQGCAVSSANMSGAGRLRDFDLSCESSMTLSFLLRGRKEELLLPVMQKRSFSCRVRNSEPRKNLSCLAAY